jgi:hypothetical protein
VGATRLLQDGTDADYLEMEALCGSAHTWFDPEGDLTSDQVAAMYADFVAGMVRAPMRVE